MFPDKVTIFNVVDDKYNRQIVDNVFFIKEKIISQDGNGDKYTSSYRVIFSHEALKKYLNVEQYIASEDKNNIFTLKENDVVVLGVCDPIKGLKDLQNSYKEYFLIRSISDNRYGDAKLQNIEVTNWN